MGRVAAQVADAQRTAERTKVRKKYMVMRKLLGVTRLREADCAESSGYFTAVFIGRAGDPFRVTAIC
jgi:hypothetical protein